MKRLIVAQLNLTVLLFYGLTTQLIAQTPSICREVIGSAGDYSSNNGFSISWTLGETIIETVESSSINVILTQGFQQPDECDTTVSVREVINDNVLIKLYPNPASQIVTLNIKSEENSPVRIELVDMLGRVMNSKDIILDSGQPTNYICDVTALTCGTYIFRIVKNNRSLNSYKFQKIPN